VHQLDRRSFLIALAVLGCPGAARAAITDLPGWLESRWGMSRTELASAFGDIVRPVPVPLNYSGLRALDMIPRIDVAGRSFVVLFQYEEARDRLAQVLVDFRGSQPTHGDFSAVFKSLTNDLGAPTDGKAETDDSGSFPSLSVEREWRFPTTIVRLRYTDPNAEAFSGVRKELVIRYTSARR
jgi:hypothetical protein